MWDDHQTRITLAVSRSGQIAEARHRGFVLHEKLATENGQHTIEMIL